MARLLQNHVKLLVSRRTVLPVSLKNIMFDAAVLLDNSQNKNTGIYTNRMSGSGIGFGRNGFKTIGIKKAKIYN